MIKKKNKGYSIFEVIIYLAIFTVMSVAVINSFILVFSSFANTRSNRDLLESGSTVMERMTREIRQAKGVDVGNSTFSSNPGVLQLNSTDDTGTDILVKFSVSSGALNLYQSGVLVGNLVGQKILVTNLIFRKITTSVGEAIKIEMTLQDTGSKDNKTANFYDTIILRGEY
jgi:Tfp pilus assembly protein PilW